MKTLLIHGGAGRIREPSPQALEALRGACEAGLSRDNALDMVVEAVAAMEDSGRFNAGQGSSLNLLGEREMDAGVMTSTGLLGAVAAVRYPRNPVRLARIVAEATDHVLLAGPGADRLAEGLGLPQIPPPSRGIMERYRRLLEEYRRGEYPIYRGNLETARKAGLMDTVGAVAWDGEALAAATSTGGVWLKLPGRVGDTPIPGAGFLATPRLAGSSTGLGEAIIRAMPLQRLDQLLASGLGLHEALKTLGRIIEDTVGPGTMGLIAVTSRGEAGIYYNTEGIYTASCTSTGVEATLHMGGGIIILQRG